MILRNSLKDPPKNSKDLQRDLAMVGVDIDSSTVRKRLVQAGRTARRPRKKQLVTDVMKKKRLVWAKNFKHWGKEQWRKVIFSDESHFEVHGHRSQYVRRSAGEPLNSFHFQQAPKHPPKKMFWGCFTFKGTGRLCPIEGMMNSTKYQEILNTKLVPSMQQPLPDGNGIVQQDNAPCHT